MGIISFIKGGVQELAIAREDQHKGAIIYKHPDKTIPMKAQLTVEADEICLFFKDGKFVAQLGPGRHTLDTSNIPFLGQLVDKFTGGNVFIAEVFFVNVREMSSQKFGGPIGKVRDGQSGLLANLMVHGTFSAKVIDPARLVIGLVGMGRSDNNAFMSWFKQLVLKTIKEDIAELIVRKKWPLVDVTSGAFTGEIEEEALKGVRTHVEPYGLEIMRFGNFHIAMSEKDEERLNKFYEKASYINMAGGMGGYQQFAQAEMMMNAGEGMAKGGGGGGGAGGALAGAGLGMGFGMAANMMGNMGAPQQHAPVNTPGTGQPGVNTVTCGKCNAQVAPGKFCANCGSELAAAPKFCANCGKPLVGKFCGECGTPAPA
jgi:membrane protease subunit (stomatin/prohibitin family)